MSKRPRRGCFFFCGEVVMTIGKYDDDDGYDDDNKHYGKQSKIYTYWSHSYSPHVPADYSGSDAFFLRDMNIQYW